MHVLRIVVQQAAQSATSPNQTSTKGAERPEQPERPERPERPEVGLHPTRDELREQIRATIKSATDAANDAANDAQQDIQIRQGQIVIPGQPGQPGVTIQKPVFGDNFIPPQAVDIANGFFVMCAVMVVGWPLARAFGRRMERGSQAPAISPAMNEQLQRIEQAVDAMSIEIERISESQRYLAKLQSSQSAEPVALPSAERR